MLYAWCRYGAGMVQVHTHEYLPHTYICLLIPGQALTFVFLLKFVVPLKFSKAPYYWRYIL
jgi:hypothetical protein